MDFISVIIPAFNSERWLDRTLQSVLAAIDAECEVIVVNDGSTDETHAIASRYVEKDPRFVLVDIEHVGPCAARKAGFLESQGEYVMFVDSDDVLPPNAIKDQRRLSESCIYTEGADRETTTDGKPKIIIANTYVKSGQKELLLISGNQRALTGLEYADEMLTRSLPGFLPGHFYARDLVEAIDWDDSPEITHQENFYLLFSFAMKLNEWDPTKKCVLVAPAVTAYHYIRRAGSQSALMALTPRGLERVWSHINKLGLPNDKLTLWGLTLLNRVFIERGIPFSSNYSMAVDLRRRAKAMGKDLPEEYRHIVKALSSLKKRTDIARNMARTAGLTSIRPHLSVIIICYRNVAKVERTIASVFGMGFRNVEVVLVDMGCSHAEKVTLNQMSIRYARVRIVKAEDATDAYAAAVLGLANAEGLSVAFVRPGDLCCSAGLYDAVTRIDYGADAVLPNYRDYYPWLHIHGKRHSYAQLRSTEASRKAMKTAANATEDVYASMVKLLTSPVAEKKDFLIYGIVWRTDFLRRNIPNPMTFRHVEAQTITHAFFLAMMKIHIRIVTQDVGTPPAFELAQDDIMQFFKRKLRRSSGQEMFFPTTYNY